MIDDRTAYDRGTEVDGAAVLDLGQSHFKHHILEGVKPQKAIDHAIVASKEFLLIVGFFNLMAFDSNSKRRVIDTKSHNLRRFEVRSGLV